MSPKKITQHKCQYCEATFDRSFNLKRHIRTKHCQNERVIAVCDVCGKILALPSLQQHRQIHERQSMKLEESSHNERKSDQPPQNARKRQREGDADEVVQPRKKLGISLDSEFPEELCENLRNNPDLLQVYRNNWREIRSSVKKGKIRSKYNCFLPTIDSVNLEECAEEVFADQTTAFKINVSFGFILRNIETDERKYYYSSGNTRIFEQPFLVKDRPTFQTFYEALKEFDSLEHAKERRPNTKWVLEIVTNATYFVYRLKDHPIGAGTKLPDFILHNQAIVSLVTNPNTLKPYTDNLCFFRCLALQKGSHRKVLERKTLELYKQFTDQTSRDFKGIRLNELCDIEDLFSVNIVVYELIELEEGMEEDRDNTDQKKEGKPEIVARLVRRSVDKYDTTLHVNLYQKHFSYIRNINKYTQSYSCSKCQKMWTTTKQLHRHEAKCECKGKWKL